jgi:rhodanese-related sulfurtransferase
MDVRQMNFVKILLINLLLGFSILMTTVSANAAQTMTAPQALSAVESGQMVLLDIRSPEEWRETGIAAIATPLTMHNQEFLNGFQKIVEANPDKEIGIICATGGRTQWLQAELAKRGLKPVIDISEGMMGSKAGPGWIARKLGMKKVQ